MSDLIITVKVDSGAMDLFAPLSPCPECKCPIPRPFKDNYRHWDGCSIGLREATLPQKPTNEETHMREIRRYSNRKLYDTTQKHYATLADLARVIREGEEIEVIEKDSQENITSQILAEIIHSEEKKKRRVPPADLIKIIRSMGA